MQFIDEISKNEENYSIAALDLPQAVEKKLRSAGIMILGDLKTATRDQLTEEWQLDSTEVFSLCNALSGLGLILPKNKSCNTEGEGKCPKEH